ncbi:MAG: hypothetical protein M3P93_08385 [Actinomycetota bacterium]|nr:hypothetical protein [Actinomycetota bacterium]
MQAVVLDAGPDAVWGAADRVLQVPSATPSGTLPTLASATPLVCTVDGSAVTVLRTGTRTLVATAAATATASYPVASATDSFVVGRRPSRSPCRPSRPGTTTGTPSTTGPGRRPPCPSP